MILYESVVASRMSKHQKNQLERHCKKKGVTISQFIRGFCGKAMLMNGYEDVIVIAFEREDLIRLREQAYARRFTLEKYVKHMLEDSLDQKLKVAS